jgi:hypothetical protein
VRARAERTAVGTRPSPPGAAPPSLAIRGNHLASRHRDPRRSAHPCLASSTSTPWNCDAHGPIGPFVFDAQVLHLDAGQVFASDALQVNCQ